MAKAKRADFVLRKDKQRQKRKGILMGLLIFTLFECYLVINLLSYRYANSTSGVVDYLMSLLQLFTADSISIPLGEIKIIEFFKCLIPYIALNFVVFTFMLLHLRKEKPFKDVEYGSAVWSTEEAYKDFKDTGNDIPVADRLYLSKGNSRIEHRNELIVGDIGAGKSYQKLIPDILQLVGSYVITDTKGALYRQTAQILKDAGYKIKVLNLLDLKYSNTFNPLLYANTPTEIERLINAFIYNTRKDGAEVGDAFWEDSMTFLLTSVISYISSIPGEQRTFTQVLDYIRSLEIARGEILQTSEYMRKINDLKIENNMHPAVINFELFMQAPQETLQSILISTTARLRLWTNEDVRILTHTDEMEIDGLVDGKTAIFLIIPDNNNAYKAILSMFITTALGRLTYLADITYKGKLPHIVSFELDEFANIGQLPDFDKMIGTIRSRNIRTMIILQNLQQLEKLYDKAEKTILSNSHLVYLGSSDLDTNEMISKRLGKATINESNLSRNYGMQGGGSESDRGLGRELLTVDELFTLPKEKCLVFFKYYNPFFAEKFHTWEHPLSSKLGIDNPNHKNFANNTDIEQAYAELGEQHIQAYNQYMRGKQGSNILLGNDIMASMAAVNPKGQKKNDTSTDESDIGGSQGLTTPSLTENEIAEQIENAHKQTIQKFKDINRGN